MSIIQALDPAEAGREKLRKEFLLAQSIACVARHFALTNDELLEFLRDGISRKRLRTTTKTIDDTMNRGITK